MALKNWTDFLKFYKFSFQPPQISDWKGRIRNNYLEFYVFKNLCTMKCKNPWFYTQYIYSYDYFMWKRHSLWKYMELMVSYWINCCNKLFNNYQFLEFIISYCSQSLPSANQIVPHKHSHQHTNDSINLVKLNHNSPLGKRKLTFQVGYIRGVDIL